MDAQKWAWLWKRKAKGERRAANAWRRAYAREVSRRLALQDEITLLKVEFAAARGKGE